MRTILIIIIVISIIILLSILIKINYNNNKIETLTEDKTEVLIKYIKLLNTKITIITFIMILPLILGIIIFLKLEISNLNNNKLPNIEFKLNK